jgi:c(7)-type cytochrome triheme protein
MRMAGNRLRFTRIGIVLGVLFVATGLLASGLDRLPKDLAIPQGADSPGQVTFRHATHVDTARPDCTTCHPRLFGMLTKRVRPSGARITHAKMQKGAFCGSCHGKTAVAFDDCTMCHK